MQDFIPRDTGLHSCQYFVSVSSMEEEELCSPLRRCHNCAGGRLPKVSVTWLDSLSHTERSILMLRCPQLGLKQGINSSVWEIVLRFIGPKSTHQEQMFPTLSSLLAILPFWMLQGPRLLLLIFTCLPPCNLVGGKSGFGHHRLVPLDCPRKRSSHAEPRSASSSWPVGPCLVAAREQSRNWNAQSPA